MDAVNKLTKASRMVYRLIKRADKLRPTRNLSAFARTATDPRSWYTIGSFIKHKNRMRGVMQNSGADPGERERFFEEGDFMDDF